MAEEKMNDFDGNVEKVVADHSSSKKKKKSRENKDSFSAEKLDEDALVNKKSKKQRLDSEAENDGNKSKKKKKSKEISVDSEPDDDDGKKKKKEKEKRVDSETEDDDDDDGQKKSKKKKKKTKEIRVDFEAADDDNGKKKKKKKEKSVDSETEDDGGKKSKKKKKSKEISVDSEAAATADDDDGNKKKKKKKKKEKLVDFEPEDDDDGGKKSKKKKKKKSKEISVDSEAATDDDGNKKKKKKKKEKLVDSETEDDDDGGKKSKKKKKKSKEISVDDDDVKDKKSKKESDDDKTGDSEGVRRDERKTGKRKRADSNLGAEENNSKEIKKNKSNVVEEKSSKKKKKKQKSDKDVTTPSSKSTKKVKFSDNVEVFPSEEEEEEEEVELVRGKRFSKEENELVKQAVLEYIDNHALGDEGVKMIMECKSHPQLKGCWKEIASALPWRPVDSVYYRAHAIFEAGSKGVWTKEDLELVKEYQKKHGNNWRTLADAMGKHRSHVKDAWRRNRLNTSKGPWSREEYQSLFDLVNKDLRMKEHQAKHSKHGMLRDNIPWMKISDELGTRDHVLCCEKWYEQLTSPMVTKGIWANVDDYRLLEELLNLDAACIDDVDWDNLLDNRDGEACRKRWNQMVRHIGSPGTKTFAEQVEILSQRYCPDIAEDRENFDNRPFDPED